MKNKTDHEEWIERWKKDLKFWFSDEGRELSLNLVAQGYTINVFNKMMVLFGSGFAAIKIVRELEEVVNE